MTFITDVRILGLPWRQWIPLRQSIQQFLVFVAVVALLVGASHVFPSVAPDLRILANLWPIAMGSWVMFMPTRRTQEEQAEEDRIVQSMADDLMSNIILSWNPAATQSQVAELISETYRLRMAKNQ